MKEYRGNYPFSYEKLRVWQNVRLLDIEVYQITDKFQSHEKFGLVDQIRGSAVSIPANIAEGSSQLSSKEQAHFPILPIAV